ncbi:MAG: helix-turn-helix domain-containing protein [Thermincolia bacterium]
MYEIEYYAEKGKIPVFEFIKEQTPKAQAKILREIDLLEEFGLFLGEPHIKKMRGTDDLWELRIKQKGVVKMNHKDIKDLLLQNPEVHAEYENSKVLYDIKRDIVKLRLAQGLSQKDLAARVGTRQSAISRLESGEYNPSVEFLSKVAHALGKELEIKFH